MSALGQKRTCAAQNGMSALPPIATSFAFSACLLWAMGGHHPGSNSFGKIFMLLGTAVLTPVK
jgi:hypothetical protein